MNKTKSKKKTIIISVVVAVIVVIIAVVWWNFPHFSDISDSEVFDGELVEETAREIIELYTADDYDGVVEYMTDDMKSVLNAATLSLSKAEMATADFGELVSYGEMYISEAKQRNSLFAMVQVSVAYTNTSIAYTLTFDENMELAGFYIK